MAPADQTASAPAATPAADTVPAVAAAAPADETAPAAAATPAADPAPAVAAAPPDQTAVAEAAPAEEKKAAVAATPAEVPPAVREALALMERNDRLLADLLDPS